MKQYFFSLRTLGPSYLMNLLIRMLASAQGATYTITKSSYSQTERAHGKDSNKDFQGCNDSALQRCLQFVDNFRILAWVIITTVKVSCPSLSHNVTLSITHYQSPLSRISGSSSVYCLPPCKARFLLAYMIYTPKHAQHCEICQLQKL